MPRSPLTETIKRAEGMVHYVQENLSAEEYMLFLDMVDPLPEQKPAKKKPGKGRTGKSGGKSPRASGMAAAISNSLESSRKATVADDLDPGLCIVGIDSKGETCDQPADANVHHLSTHPDYHEFNAGKPGAHSAAG